MPGALAPRVFPVVVITLRRTHGLFYTVQIPVDLQGFDRAFYSNGRNLTEGDGSQQRKKPVFGLVIRKPPMNGLGAHCVR